jgi:hypothetical protein
MTTETTSDESPQQQLKEKCNIRKDSLETSPLRVDFGSALLLAVDAVESID